MKLCAVTLLLLLSSVHGGRILLYPYGHCLNSHLLNAEKLANTLQNHGHDVSMLISDMYDDFDHLPHVPKLTTSRLTMLKFEAPSNYTPICDYDTVDFMMYSPIQQRFDTFVDTSVKYCDQLLSNQALLHSIKQSHFDVFIMESLDPCSRILADYLQIPFIPLMTAGLGHWDGNPRQPSYLPAAIAPFTNKMTFTQRMGNFIMKFLYDNIPLFMGFDLPFEQLKVKYNMDTSLSLSTTFNRAAVKLINSDFAIEYPSPVGPDSILIGGFSLEEPQTLSNELEEFMQSAGPAGVIIMSTGTLVKTFDEHWTRLFAAAFARLPQKVIWRYHGPANDSLGENIKLIKWMPQLDLLAHPQTQLFITHSGLNSLFEAVYTATPVIAIPMSGDQMNNAAKLTDHVQMGVKVDMFSITSDILYNAIKTVLNDQTYAHNAKLVSQRFRDQPMSRSDKVNYWVDYVIRHRGAEHLKSTANELSLLQYFSIDIIATLLCIAITVATSLLIIILYFVGFLKNQIVGKCKLQ